MYEENDVVAFKPKKVAIAFEVLEDGDDDDSLLNINEVGVCAFVCTTNKHVFHFHRH